MNRCKRSMDRNKGVSRLLGTFDVVVGSRGVDAKQFGYWARRVKVHILVASNLDLEPDPKTNANCISVKRT